MKLLLPALCLLALTACTAPQPTAPEASPEQASPETTTVAVTVDNRYTYSHEGVQTDPLFYLDETQDKLADAGQAICDGSRVTYQVTVPAGTTDLYVSPLLLRSTETVEEQSAPARGDQQLPDFRVDSVTLETQDGQAVVVVAIDPQSTAFPADLTLHTGDMIRTGGLQLPLGMGRRHPRPCAGIYHFLFDERQRGGSPRRPGRRHPPLERTVPLHPAPGPGMDRRRRDGASHRPGWLTPRYTPQHPQPPPKGRGFCAFWDKT